MQIHSYSAIQKLQPYMIGEYILVDSTSSKRNLDVDVCDDDDDDVLMVDNGCSRQVPEQKEQQIDTDEHRKKCRR